MSGLGRVYSPDKRDKKFLMPLRKLEVLPTYKHWPTCKPLDQGNTSSCVGHAGMHWLISSPIINKPKFSAFDLYLQAQNNDEPPTVGVDEGSTTRGLMKALIALGMVSDYQWDFEGDRCIAHLLAVGPVIIGINWKMDMFDTDKDGFIHYSGRNQGGHENFVHGINLKKKCSDGSVGAVRGMNSWGPKWGDKGHYWMSIPDFKKALRDQGEAVTATEVKLLRR